MGIDKKPRLAAMFSDVARSGQVKASPVVNPYTGVRRDWTLPRAPRRREKEAPARAEPWVVRRIGDFAWDVNERASDGVLEVLSVTKHAGFMASLEFFGKQVFSKDTSNYKIVRRGQFAYATIHLDEGSVDCLNIRDAGIISPMYTVFDVDEAVVDRRYMLELLKSPGMLQRYAAIGAGSVNRRRSISFDTLAAEELRLPPLAEQKKIAQILSSVDEAIEATQAVVDQTRRVKEAMLQTLLTRGLGHTRFKQTEIGEIPEAWEVRRLDEIATVRGGYTKNSGRKFDDPIDVAYLRVANVQDGYLNLADVKTITIERAEIERFALQDGDVLMNEGGDIDKLGRGDVWRGQIHPCINQNHVFAVRCGAALDAQFLAYLAASPYGKSYFLSAGKQSTNLASINKSQLSAFPVPLPSMTEQQNIVGHIQAIDRATASTRLTVNALQSTKSALLQTLLSGQTRVTP
jgi:type I restriction enzyme S subunit